jgi:hypothetical protein
MYHILHGLDAANQAVTELHGVPAEKMEQLRSAIQAVREHLPKSAHDIEHTRLMEQLPSIKAQLGEDT